ncbi:MAG TPA: nicotinate phosphoribosyltransferase [Aminobacterium sp.]|uniref:nicotinate phosphoribosyltransferase n=2 Tax=Aminobacteriaceae TaxID=3029087 RepID=UPI000ED95BAA|nr:MULTISPECIES: nicotinate phosphoribosyltransferase [unclassified Aminobacterium]HCA41437.1 nicotinate phosphoribosyltransferase [Aminobacterium sp.]
MTKNGNLDSLEDLSSVQVRSDRLFSATHEEILSGLTSDVYFLKTRDVLRRAGKLHTPVVAEFFARGHGIFAGLPEAMQVLKDKKVAVYALQEGDPFAPKDVVMRISGSYSEFGLYETVLLGFLASSSGWATAARQCVEAAEGKPVLCFGARHVHPAIASVMERAAVVVGGCTGASCMLGAKLANLEPTGTVPHAAVLIMGDTVELAKVYDAEVPEKEARIVLVDTFKDEAEESLRVARTLGDRLFGVRLDTPGERGGVTVELVKEVRYRLNLAGFSHVRIIASGGLTPDRIRVLSEAGVDSFGVGSYITHGAPRDMTMDLKVVDGVPVAKRGRLPGMIENPRLIRVQ